MGFRLTLVGFRSCSKRFGPDIIAPAAKINNASIVGQPIEKTLSTGSSGGATVTNHSLRHRCSEHHNRAASGRLPVRFRTAPALEVALPEPGFVVLALRQIRTRHPDRNRTCRGREDERREATNRAFRQACARLELTGSTPVVELVAVRILDARTGESDPNILTEATVSTFEG